MGVLTDYIVLPVFLSFKIVVVPHFDVLRRVLSQRSSASFARFFIAPGNSFRILFPIIRENRKESGPENVTLCTNLVPEFVGTSSCLNSNLQKGSRVRSEKNLFSRTSVRRNQVFGPPFGLSIPLLPTLNSPFKKDSSIS